MRLYEAVGMIKPDADSDESVEKATGGARAFLLGGGTLSLIEWGTLSEGEQAALANAGDEIRREAACWAGIVSNNPAMAEVVQGAISEEDLVAETAVLQLANAGAARLTKGAA